MYGHIYYNIHYDNIEDIDVSSVLVAANPCVFSIVSSGSDPEKLRFFFSRKVLDKKGGNYRCPMVSHDF